MLILLSLLNVNVLVWAGDGGLAKVVFLRIRKERK